MERKVNQIYYKIDYREIYLYNDAQHNNRIHILRGHTSRVNSVAISSDNKYVISGSNDKTTRIWNIESAECILTLKGQYGYYTSVAVSSDNKYVISGSNDKTVRIWNTESGQCIHILKGHTDYVKSVVISSDNKYVISGSDDKTVRIWHVESGLCVNVIKGRNDVNNIKINDHTMHDRYLVNFIENNNIYIDDTLSDSHPVTFQGHSNTITAVVISSDNKYVISGSNDKTTRIWNIESAECILTLKGQYGYYTSVAVSSDNKYVISGSDDNTVRIWHLESGQCIHTLKGHTDTITAVVISSDNKYVISGSSDGTIRVSHIESGICIFILQCNAGIYDLKLTSDDKFVIASYDDNKYRVWNIETEKCIETLNGYNRSITEVALKDNYYAIKNPRNLLIYFGKNCIKVCEANSMEHNDNINNVLLNVINIHSCRAGFGSSVEEKQHHDNPNKFEMQRAATMTHVADDKQNTGGNRDSFALLEESAKFLYEHSSDNINQSTMQNSDVEIPSEWAIVQNDLKKIKEHQSFVFSKLELPNNMNELFSNFQPKYNKWRELNVSISSASAALEIKEMITKRDQSYKESYEIATQIHQLCKKVSSNPSGLKKLVYHHDECMKAIRSFSLFDSPHDDQSMSFNMSSLDIPSMINKLQNEIIDYWRKVQNQLPELKKKKSNALKHVRMNARALVAAIIEFDPAVKLSLDELCSNLTSSMNKVVEIEADQKKSCDEICDDSILLTTISRQIWDIYSALLARKKCLENMIESFDVVYTFLLEVDKFSEFPSPTNYLKDQMKVIWDKYKDEIEKLAELVEDAEYNVKKAKRKGSDNMKHVKQQYKDACSKKRACQRLFNAKIEKMVMDLSRFCPEVLNENFAEINEWTQRFLESYKSGALKKIGMDISLYDLEPISASTVATNHAVFKGRLKEVSDVEESLDYAFKEFNSTDLKKLMREVRILSCFKHPYIVEVLSIIPGKLKTYIQMPFYKYGSLNNWLVKNPNISFNKRRILGRQLLNAIECVHNAGVIHCDIKPQNIFMESDDHLRLGDFDVSMKNKERATFVATTTVTSAVKGFTLAYAAPELLENKEATTASDIYSFGIVLSIIFVPDLLEKIDQNNNQVIIELVKDGLKSDDNDVDANNVNQLEDLLSKMLDKNPNNRPNATDIRLHPFFTTSELSLVAAEDERKGDKYTCNVCFLDYYEMHGVKCPNNKHFLCKSCFSDHVLHSSTTKEGRQKRRGNVYCVMHTVKDDECYQQLDKPYSEALIAKYVSNEAFIAYTKCHHKVVEEKLFSNFDAELQARVANEMEILRQLSEEEREIRQCRLYITENILNLRCPNPNGCNQVFVDFDGCFALSCSKCNTQFCGWCLEWCHNDAHPHVRKCQYKLGADPYFASKEEFNRAHRERRKGAVRQYLSTLSDELAEKVKDAIWQDLRDLQLL